MPRGKGALTRVVGVALIPLLVRIAPALRSQVTRAILPLATATLGENTAHVNTNNAMTIFFFPGDSSWALKKIKTFNKINKS